MQVCSRSVSLVGQVTYRMFVPQANANWIPKPLQVQPPTGTPMRLLPDRLGHFQPLGKQQPFVTESIRMALLGDPLLDAIVFPQRAFWILTPDPEDPTGAFATWGKISKYCLGRNLCCFAGLKKTRQSRKK